MNIQPFVLKEYFSQTHQIDKIAQRTIQQNSEKLHDKYVAVHTTLKHLQGLLNSFKKKSEEFQKDFRKKAKIDELIDRTHFHEKKIGDCQRLATVLEQQIGHKRTQIDKQEQIAQKLRKQIIQHKTQNIKKIYAIEELEKKQKDRQKQIYIKEQIMKSTKSKMMHANLLRQIQQGKVMTKEDAELEKQKNRLIKDLSAKINERIEVWSFIDDLFEVYSKKLTQNQKKSKDYGLNGSLLFKIQTNKQRKSEIIKPANCSSANSSIFKILKNKYTNEMRSVKNEENDINVSEQQFLNYTPLQLMGIIELKGGWKGTKKIVNKSQNLEMNAKKKKIQKR